MKTRVYATPAVRRLKQQSYLILRSEVRGFYTQYPPYRTHILNMLKIKCDINQQDLKRVDLHFVKSE